MTKNPVCPYCKHEDTKFDYEGGGELWLECPKCNKEYVCTAEPGPIQYSTHTLEQEEKYAKQRAAQHKEAIKVMGWDRP